MNNLRLFFAIQFETELREALSKFIAELNQEPWAQQVHWTRPENLHVTLRFLGDCPPKIVSKLLQAVTTAIKEIKPFSLQLNTLQLFPSPDHPHVIVVNLLPSKALLQLVNILEDSAVAMGFKSEKKDFIPHVTLGRVIQKPIVLVPEKYKLAMTDFSVQEIILLSSEKAASGRVYQVVRRFGLAN